MPGFPARKGWKMDTSRGPIPTASVQPSPDSLAASLQAWVFFGMRRDKFQSGGILEKNAFVHHQDDEYYITIAPLKRHIDQWAEIAKEQALEASQHHQRQLRQCFFSVKDFFFHYWDSPEPGRWTVLSCLNVDLVLSILILGESLIDVTNKISYVPGQPRVIGRTSLVRGQNLLKDRLIG